MLITFSTLAQISFYGAPEPIDSLNSPVSEENIVLGEDGRTIFFTRKNHQENLGGIQDMSDIWVSYLESEVWSTPENLAIINDVNYTSPIGFTRGGNYFLYNKVRFEKGIYIGEIWVSDASFKNAKKLDIRSFKNRAPVQSGSISQDGRFLMLSIETSIGYGVDDLYVCELQPDGSWSAPRNLGYEINTAFQEITPFLAGDNKTLFFATNGREGEGSFDIYETTRLDDTWRSWSTPKNLADINTGGAESSLVFQSGADYAYFVSTRNSDGYGDIKKVSINAEIEEVVADTVLEMVIEKQPIPSIKFHVANIKTGTSIPATVTAINQNGDSLDLPGMDSLYVLASEERLPYRVQFKSQGFLKDFLVVSPDSYDPAGDTIVTISLEPLQTGNTVTLKNVLFYQGTANFVEGSEKALDLIVEMLGENPNVKILLKGHTDNRGNAELNLQLSEERANAVANYLLEEGISDDRIDGMGYGGKEPIASNLYEETRRLNRRVEFEVIAD